MTASKIMAKRAAAGTLALAVCLTGGLVSAGAANAAAGFTFENNRVAGADRYETAIAASKLAFPATSEAVVLVSGAVGAEVDGLTASYVAGVRGAPILYTQGPNGVTAGTSAEIARLQAKTVYIVGGSTVVSAAFEASLKAQGKTVVRYDGSDRYDTAAKVATSNGTTKPGKVIVASGVSFADALAVGPVAYKQKYPILLTAGATVSTFTTAALTSLAVPTVNVVGGTTVVSDAVYAEVGGDKRLAGENRQETATKIAADAITAEGFSAANIALVGNTNANAADALVATPLAAKNNTPLLFIDNATTTYTNTYLSANQAALTGTGYVFGGTTAVPTSSVSAAAVAATTASTPVAGKISITPSAATSLTSAAYSSTNAATYVEYTATVPTDVKTVSIRLAAPSDVKSSTSGTTFTKEDGFLRADFTDADAELGAANIQQYNGIATSGSPKFIDDVPVVSGQVTFRVATTGVNTAGAAVPVVFKATSVGGVGRLPVNATGAPTDVFGVGGTATFTPGEATAGTSTNAVKAVGATSFTGSTSGGVAGVFQFRDGDTYQLNGAGSTFAAFQAALSVGDSVVVSSYAPIGAAGTRAITFNLTDDKVAAPTNLVGALRDADLDGSNDQLRLTFTAPASNLGTTVSLKTAPVTDGVVGTFATSSQTASYSGTTGTINLAVPSVGSYVYQVAIPGRVGSTLSDYSANSGTVVIAAASLSSVASAAVSTSTTYAEGGTADSTVNTGDVITVTFNEPIASPAADASFRLTDQDATTNTIGTLTNGVNATFTRAGSANNQLRIAVTSAPSISVTGTAAGVQYPFEISNATGIKDTDVTAKDWNTTIGETTVAGSTVVIPAVTSGTLSTTASAYATFDQTDLPATTALIPGATVTLTITGGSNSGTTYPAVVQPNGSFSVAAPLVVSTSVISVTQTVSGAGTSAAKTANIA